MPAKQQIINLPSRRLRGIGGPIRERRASHTDVRLIKHALSEASLPRGFRFAATACGLKKTGALDLAIFCSDAPASAAAVFTQNLVVAAPVLISKEHLRASKGRMRAVVVNAGNANCATGSAGRVAAERTVAEAAKRLGCAPQELFVCSTGVIGVPLPLDKILRALPVIARHRRSSARSFAETSLAICTTDTRPKPAAASFKMVGKRINLVGCAKGAGMIHPNMATMLAFVATDAAIAPSLLQKTLLDVTGHTFNAISVDGDTSTNDTLLVLANGEAGAPRIKADTSAHRAFTAALEEVCRSLALQIVADGEGAQRVIEIEVRHAKSEAAARRIAETIATSPLVKTAFEAATPTGVVFSRRLGVRAFRLTSRAWISRWRASPYCGVDSRSISTNAPQAIVCSPNTFNSSWICTRAKPWPVTGPAISQLSTCVSMRVIAPNGKLAVGDAPLD